MGGLCLRVSVPVVAILIRNDSARILKMFRRCFGPVHDHGTPRRALLAQTGLGGASRGTSETGGGTVEVRPEHDEDC